MVYFGWSISYSCLHHLINAVLLLTQVHSCRNCAYASFYVSFATADAADNRVHRTYLKYYVIGWTIAIIVTAISACQFLPKATQSKGVRFGVDHRNLSDYTASVSDSRSTKTGVSGLSARSHEKTLSSHRPHLSRSDSRKSTEKKGSRKGLPGKSSSRPSSRSKSKHNR